MSRGLRPELKEFIHSAVDDIVSKHKVVEGCPMRSHIAAECKISGIIADSIDARLLCTKNYTTCNTYKEWASDKSTKERAAKENKQAKVEEKQLLKKIKTKGKRGRPIRRRKNERN